ncbi:hypothetical protein HanRHA438_Chr17g0807441 [Helianthus annuus]|nr:hypothetical protein HanRHA438_Chr17g0807441 [Helianthus annuus]
MLAPTMSPKCLKGRLPALHPRIAAMSCSWESPTPMPKTLLFERFTRNPDAK